MKFVLHTIILAFAAMMLMGCEESTLSGVNDARPTDRYWLAVSFKDASGNDLVAPLKEEIMNNPNVYQLDVILSNPHESWDNTIYNVRAKPGLFIPDVRRPYFSIAKYDDSSVRTISPSGEEFIDGDYSLFSDFSIPAINGLQNSLTYIITCPTIFGDNTKHEIVVFWDEDPAPLMDAFKHPECRSAIFEGKDVDVKKMLLDPSDTQKYYCYLLEIVLDR